MPSKRNGLRINGGRTLRLLVDGHGQAETTEGIKGVFVAEGKAGTETVTARPQEGFLRNRCTITAAETVLEDTTRPRNALGLLVVGFPRLVFGCIMLAVL